MKNRLLAALPAQDWNTLQERFEAVDLPLGSVLYEPGQRIERVYFPTSGVVSTVALLEGSAMVEMATTGNEGVVSTVAVLGGETAIARNIVQVPGSALTLSRGALAQAQQDSPALRGILLAYVQTFIAQALQSVACNGTHTVEQRAARWLLTTHDRSEGDTFGLTQEFLAVMLGVSRMAVSTVSRTLQKKGLIRTSRGFVTVLNRAGLEEVSCACYHLIRRHYEERIRPVAPQQARPRADYT